MTHLNIYYQYSLAIIIRGTKSKWKRQARACGMRERDKNSYKVLVGKSEGNGSLRRPGSK